MGPATERVRLPGDDEMPLAVVRLVPPVGGGPGAVAVLDVAERRALTARLGPAADDVLRARLAALATDDSRPGEVLSVADDGALVLVLPSASEDEAAWRFEELARLVAHETFVVAAEVLHLTPLIGWSPAAADPARPAPRAAAAARAEAAAREALADAAFLLDLHPVRRSA